ncbi:alpha/beta hydrolase [Amycolatopsis solani]|uniref:alpha/beta hydrolase n=1 Tax=Amycolatopsis solani TaxID=3028615 RepID=UPI0025B08320|nr:alpha/beta hydrolase [Amycolatopsis sp. MEP2-6]
MRFPQRRRSFVIVGLAAVVLVLAAFIVWPDSTVRVPPGAAPDSLAVSPCSYDTEAGSLAADCGTLVVAENRNRPGSRLIALPGGRIRAPAQPAGEPLFRLGGGPGQSNLDFPQASRLAGHHDVVLVGYRGVDGSSRLDCAEVTDALQSAKDMTGPEALPRTRRAFDQCADRLRRTGVDLTGYSIVQRIEDLESARKALGYPRIDLVSSSAGTRTATIYAWRHPDALLRSAMISVNPPGHLSWDPRTTDAQFGQYADVCRADRACAAKTADLAATIRSRVATMPASWGPFGIKNTNVRVLSQYAMHMNGRAEAPSNAPTVIDAYLDGGPGAMWAMSVLADLTLPTSTVWGELASFSMIDAPVTQAYYDRGGDPGSILGNSSTDFLWGGPDGFSRAGPDSPDNAEYRTVRPSAVETLLIGGEFDLSTPPVNATKELLPSLSRGHQVIVPGIGHTGDFWAQQPDAADHLLETFYDSGRVDSSRFVRTPVDLTAVPLSMSLIAGLLVGVTTGVLLLALLALIVLARRRRRRGAPGRWIRWLGSVPLGIAGWFLGVLFAWTFAPQWFVTSLAVVVPGTGLLVGLWVHWARPAERPALALTLLGGWVGALLGALAGSGLLVPVTAIAGAVLGANAVVAIRGHRQRSAIAATG